MKQNKALGTWNSLMDFQKCVSVSISQIGSQLVFTEVNELLNCEDFP